MRMAALSVAAGMVFAHAILAWTAPGWAESHRMLASLAREVQSKGEAASDFDNFAAILGVAEDDGSLRLIRFTHNQRGRSVWTRLLPEATDYEVYFADFRPEFGLLFKTNEDGTLERAFRLAPGGIPPLELDHDAAMSDFERERAYWLRWAR